MLRLEVAIASLHPAKPIAIPRYRSRRSARAAVLAQKATARHLNHGLRGPLFCHSLTDKNARRRFALCSAHAATRPRKPRAERRRLRLWMARSIRFSLRTLMRARRFSPSRNVRRSRWMNVFHAYCIASWNDCLSRLRRRHSANTLRKAFESATTTAVRRDLRTILPSIALSFHHVSPCLRRRRTAAAVPVPIRPRATLRARTTSAHLQAASREAGVPDRRGVERRGRGREDRMARWVSVQRLGAYGARGEAAWV